MTAAIPEDIDDAYRRLTSRLRALGSIARAEKEKSYQKSAWEHWGVPLPKMDLAIREMLHDVHEDRLIRLSACLWGEPVWDLIIQKAIGWWLRELSKQDPARCAAFLPSMAPRSRAWRAARRENTWLRPGNDAPQRSWHSG
jgi:hypothetical protein